MARLFLADDLRSQLALHIELAGWDEIERQTGISEAVLVKFVAGELDIPLSIAGTIADYLGCRLTRPNARWRQESQKKRVAPPKKRARRTSSVRATIPFPDAKR